MMFTRTITISKPRQWLIVNYVVNVARKFLPTFYMFMNESLCVDDIVEKKTMICMIMTNNM
jgi:hypothetical protein